MKIQTPFKYTNLFFSLALLISFISSVHGQEPTPATSQKWTDIYDLTERSSFEAIQENFRAYWEDREIEKGHGYKPFKRWEAYMAPRIYPSNDLSLVGNTYFNFQAWERNQPVQEAAEKSFAGNWTALGPFQKATGDDTGVGRLNMVRFDPLDNSIMYVGAADGGLWKSSNSGTSWSTNTDFLGVIGVADLAIHPTATSTMYLATGDAESDRRSIGVLKSTNGGASWNPTGLSWTAIDDYSIRKLLIHPNNPQILLAATNKGVFRTTNGGGSWTPPATIQNFKDMEFKPTDPSTVYACSNTMWKSTDTGATWTQVTNGVPSSDVVRLSIAVTPDQPGYVYLMAGKQSNNGLLGIYRSTDSGTTFSTRFEPNYAGTLGTPSNPNILGNEPDGSDAAGQAFYTLALAASPTDADFLLAGGVSQWASYDGGSTWTLSSHWYELSGFSFVHADTHEIYFTSDGNAYSSNDGGLSKYDDSDGTWTDISNNLTISQQTILGMSASNANKMAVGLQDIGTILNTAPNTWKVIGGGDGEYCFIDRTNDDIIVETGTNGSHAISTDCGLTFNDIVTGLPTDGSTGEVEFQSPIHQDPSISTTYYAGGRKNLYYSSNQGTSWTARGIAFPDDDSNIIEFKIAPSNNQIIYATNGPNLSKSTDAGVTWDYLAEPTLGASVTQLAISNIDPDKVWVTYSGYSANDKVFKSTDGGDSWTNLSAGLPNLPFNTVVFQNGSNDLVYVGSDIGVYHRDNAASSWTSFFTDLPRTRVRDLKIFYPTMKLRAATYGRGTWESDVASSVLPVTLQSFTGANREKANQLSWVTTEETDLAHYEIERSSNGTRFTAIGQVRPRSSNATTIRSYNYNDEQPLNGINYYRLKITDLDGSFEYSRVINLFVEDELSTVSVYPNPAINVLNFTGINEDNTTVKVMNSLGRTVIIQTVSSNEGLNISRLPIGNYFLEITAGGQSTYKRFVKN